MSVTFVDREAEEFILGAVMLAACRGNPTPSGLDGLISSDFGSEVARVVWEAVDELRRSGLPCTPLDVRDELKKRGKWRERMLELFDDWMDSVHSIALVPHYAQKLLAASDARQLRDYGRQVDKLVKQGRPTDIRILSLPKERSGGAPTDCRRALHEAFERVERVFDTKKAECGIGSSLSDLDELTTGFYPGELTIIGARPGIGKTALALQIAKHVGMKVGPVFFASLEMTEDRLMERLLCSTAEVDSRAIRLGRVTEDMMERVQRAADMFQQHLKLHIVDTPSLQVSEIEQLAARVHGLKLLIVDYLQICGSDGKASNRTEEVSKIAYELKNTAKRLDVPVIALSQLARTGDTGKPKLSDLRESGMIEASADVVIVLYWPDGFQSDQGTAADAAVLKCRNGAQGVVHLRYIPVYTKFVQIAK